MPASACLRFAPGFASGLLLACLLLANEVDGGTIQALCRWRSPESLAIYARLEPSKYCNLLENTLNVSVLSSEAAHLIPQIDHALLVGNFADRAARALGGPTSASRIGSVRELFVTCAVGLRLSIRSGALT